MTKKEKQALINSAPFQTGDDIYKIIATDPAGSPDGHCFAEIRRVRYGVRGVAVSADDKLLVVADDGMFVHGSRNACTSKDQAMHYIRDNMPNAILLDTKTSAAVYTADCGHGIEKTRLPLSLKQLAPYEIASGIGPDGYILLKTKHAYGQFASVYTLDIHGNPVDYVSGRLLWIKLVQVKWQDGPGVLQPMDAGDPPAGYVSPKNIADVPRNFWPESRLCMTDMTVSEFCEKLKKRYPDNAVVKLNDFDAVYAHYSPIYNELVLSETAMSERSEYEGHEIKQVTGSGHDGWDDGYYLEDEIY